MYFPSTRRIPEYFEQYLRVISAQWGRFSSATTHFLYAVIVETLFWEANFLKGVPSRCCFKRKKWLILGFLLTENQDKQELHLNLRTPRLTPFLIVLWEEQTLHLGFF